MSSANTIDPALLAIIESLPMHPRSADILGALLRAEQAGYARAVAEFPVGYRAAISEEMRSTPEAT